MNAIWTIARKELSDSFRNRWLVAISLVFATLALGIAWFGAAASGQVGYASTPATIASLASLGIFLIPLIALLLAYDAIVGEEEGGTLLLLMTYPLSKSQLLLGKFLGHGLTLAPNGDVWVTDVGAHVVIRYDAAKGGTRQPMHRDAALLSVNIALSSPDEYEGGGTLFQTVGGGPVRLGRGHVMVHASGVRHAGAPITAGERWVLVVFALAEGVPQHARRSAERGAEARRAGRLAEARAAFDAAVVACPTDHEARHGLAIVQLMQGEDAEARRSLATAAR